MPNNLVQQNSELDKIKATEQRNQDLSEKIRSIYQNRISNQKKEGAHISFPPNFNPFRE